PLEKYIYLTLVISITLVTLGFAKLATGYDRFLKFPPAHITGAVLAVLAAALLYYGYPSIAPPVTPSFFLAFARNILASITITLLMFLGFGYVSERARNLIVLLLAVGIVTYLARQVVTTGFDQIIQSTHYEVFAYPIIQQFLGDPILVTQRSQYGLYPIFLEPLWAFVTPRPFQISFVFALLFSFSFAAFICFIARTTVTWIVTIPLTLAGIVFSLLWFSFWPTDLYLQLFPLRLVFPAVALLLALRSPPQTTAWLVFSYVLLWLGVYWNLESGIIGLATFTSFVLIGGGEIRNAGWLRSALKFVVLIGSAGLAVFVLVNLYFLARYHVFPEWKQFLIHIQVYSLGLNALPIPRIGIWELYLGIYGLSFITAFQSVFTNRGKETDRRAGALSAMAVMGILYLYYYVGRSHNLVISWVSFPAFICLALLVDELLPLLARVKVRKVISHLAFLVAAVIFTSMLMYINYFKVMHRNWFILYHHMDPFPVEVKITKSLEWLERSRVAADDDILFLTPYATIAQVRLGRPGQVHADGICQIWFEEDAREVVSVIENPKTRVVVLDGTSNCPIGEIVLHGAIDPKIPDYLQSNFDEVETPEDRG
ncbi:MAG: hypothetical protein KDE28_15860, partial [Anaerolineales bacterium]|nr:hypothetical protein [Anaerolineales bacterium]